MIGSFDFVPLGWKANPIDETPLIPIQLVVPPEGAFGNDVPFALIAQCAGDTALGMKRYNLFFNPLPVADKWILCGLPVPG